MPLLFTGPHSQPRRLARDNARNRNREDLHIVFKGPAGCLRQWSQGVGTRSIRLPHSSPADGSEGSPPPMGLGIQASSSQGIKSKAGDPKTLP